MITRRRNLSSANFSHRLESLEARSQMSVSALADLPEAVSQAAQIADESFLTAASDPTPAGSPTQDLESAAPPAAPSAQSQSAPADLGFGAISQSRGHPPASYLPSDLLPSSPDQYSAPTKYEPLPVEPVNMDAPQVPDPTPAPVANSPETPAPGESRPADQTPVITTVGTDPTAGSTFVWLESSESWLLKKGSGATDQVVIASTFL